MRAGMRAAGDPGFVGDLPKVAAVGEGQERIDQRARQGDDIAIHSAFRRGLPGAGADEIGQAFEIGLGKRQVPGLFVMQHVLAEFGVQHGEAFGDFRHPRFLGWPQRGPLRTKPRCVRSSSRRWSSLRAKVSRWSWRASTRLKTAGSSDTCMPCCASLGDISRSSASSASPPWLATRFPNTLPTRAKARPLRSKASIVLAKLGGASDAPIAAISARLLGHGHLESRREVLRLDEIEGRNAEGRGPGDEEWIAGVHGAKGDAEAGRRSSDVE